MAPRYDVLAVDLDGTLLGSDGHVSVRNREALAAARDAGMTVVLATGRALAESAAAIDQTAHDGSVIAGGGSLLCHAGSGRTIERRVMDRGIVEHAAEVLERHGHRTIVLKDVYDVGYDYLLVGQGRIDEATAWWFRTLAVEVRYAANCDDDEHPEASLRVGAVADSATLEPIARELEGSIGDRAFLQHWPAVTASHATGGSTHLLEIFDADVNKWTMLERLCRHAGHDPGSVAAIGDGLNDVDLIANASLGVAMANAHDPVRAVADRHTGHHDEDGVADAVEMIVRGDW